MYLLDTNVCIDFLNGRSEALAQRMSTAFGALTISTVTVGELLVGSKASADPQADAKRINTFVASVNLAPFDRTAAETYGSVIRKIGVRRKSFDQLIGAQALALGLILVTRNEKDFADVPGLKIENWTLPL